MEMENRRNFIKKVSMLAAGGLAVGNLSAVSSTNIQAKAKKIVGLQIYSVMRELNVDVPAGMKKLAQIGYRNLELAGYDNGKIADIPVSEYRRIVEDAGLKITGSHVNLVDDLGVSKYTKENMPVILDFWKKVTEDHVKLGIRSLVQPSMPPMETHDDVKIVCEVFNKIGEITKSAGFRWGYHNHSGEFKRIVSEEQRHAASQGGRRGPQGDVIYALMLNNTDPSLVFFEMDVYWTVMGQADPVEYLNKYSDRFPILHIKDRLVLGESGMMNFDKIFRTAYSHGLDDYFVELEGIRPDSGMTQFEGVKRCLDYLINAPFVK
jgi:sugar phosphate isomerase/epimerase